VSASSRGMSGSKEEWGPLFSGGARDFALVCIGRGVGRVVVPVGETGGREGAGAWGGGTADMLCDRSRKDAFMGERPLSSVGKVGTVAITP